MLFQWDLRENRESLINCLEMIQFMTSKEVPKLWSNILSNLPISFNVIISKIWWWCCTMVLHCLPTSMVLHWPPEQFSYLMMVLHRWCCTMVLHHLPTSMVLHQPPEPPKLWNSKISQIFQKHYLWHFKQLLTILHKLQGQNVKKNSKLWKF